MDNHCPGQTQSSSVMAREHTYEIGLDILLSDLFNQVNGGGRDPRHRLTLSTSGRTGRPWTITVPAKLDRAARGREDRPTVDK